MLTHVCVCVCVCVCARVSVPTQLLPIDTTRDDIKENLKKSQLGSRVMFLANCQEESQQNRKLATELVHKWARWVTHALVALHPCTHSEQYESRVIVGYSLVQVAA